MAITRTRGTSGTGALGADAVVDLTSDATGDLAYVLCRCSGSTPPTVPTGWTTLATDTNGSMVRVLACRQKQAGDTTFTFVIPGSSTSAYTLDVWRGGIHGQVSTATNQAASGNLVAYDPLTMRAGSASFCVGTWTNAGGSIVGQSGYSGGVSGSQITTTYKLAVPAGALDPPDATLSSSSPQNRIGWHVEIRDANITGTLSISGGGSIAMTGRKDAAASLPLTAGGQIAAAGAKTALGAVAISGGGQVAANGQKTALGPLAVSGPAAISITAAKHSVTSLPISGGGAILAAGVKTAAGALSVAGGGQVAAAGAKTASAALLITGGGDISFTGGQIAIVGGPLRISGGGSINLTGRKDASGALSVAGGGRFDAAVMKTALGALTLSGGGTVRIVGSGPVAGVVGRLLLEPVASGALTAAPIAKAVMQLDPVVAGEITRSDV